jgi:hypothetical protein
MPTPQLGLAVVVIQSVLEIVRELGRVPSGHVYATLTAKGCTINQWSAMVSVMTGTGLVELTKGHELVWIGPKIDQ